MINTRHLIDPELRHVFDAVPEYTLSDETIGENRALLETMMKDIVDSKPDFTGMTVTERHIPGPDGAPDVRILILRPDDDGEPVLRPGILETHGGGLVMGSADASTERYASLIRELGAVMVSVDYRLAPETPFPGPVEDAYTAFRWMIANAAELKIDPVRIAVTGISGGATPAAAVALLARDRDQIPIAFMHLSQPMLDDRTCTNPDLSPYVGEFVWTRENNAYGWTSWLGCAPGSEGISPYAAPGRMEDLRGFPPTFINCGSLDMFAEESLDFAKRLIRSGVPVELHIYPGFPHGAPFGTTGYWQQVYDRDELAAWKRGLKITSA